MSLRMFTDRHGGRWNAWNVVPGGTSGGYQERYRDGWVCFEKVGGGGRCRLPLKDMPPGWESLPEDRLDLLRRVAEQPSNTGPLAKYSEDDKRLSEDEAISRKSGPHELIGTDEYESF